MKNISEFDFETEISFPIGTNFLAVTKNKIEYRRQTEPFVLSEDSAKIKKYRLLIVPSVFTSLQKVTDTEDNLVVMGQDLEYFSEALNCFVHNWLIKGNDSSSIVGKKYETEEEEGGFEAKVMEKDKHITLGVVVADKTYYLTKYDCRVILASLQKVNNKCGIEALRAKREVLQS